MAVYRGVYARIMPVPMLLSQATNCDIQASMDCLNVFSIAHIAPSKANTIREDADVVPNKETALSARITAIADFKVLRPM